MNRRIHDWLRTSAETRPDHTAIVWQNRHLSFAELDCRSNQLAHMLREQGCKQSDRVAFCMPKSPPAYIAMHAALKADGLYVPLDPEGPTSRLAQVIKASEPTIVLCSPTTLKMTTEAITISGQQQVRLGLMDDNSQPELATRVHFNENAIAAMPDTLPASKSVDSDAAHLLFTSGSTGVPKGVIITHANVTAFVDWGVRHFGISSDDRLSGHSPLFFDLSTFDTYASMATGAQLHPVPPTLNLMAPALVRFIQQHELTQWFSVPSVLSYLKNFDAINKGTLPALKRLLWCGEVLPTPVLRWLMQRIPHAAFTNLYGPTEATIASSYYTVPQIPASDSQPLPIGYPCAGESLTVLDKKMRPVAVGETGNLYIGGAGLSPGYWCDTEKTTAAFFDNAGAGCSRLYATGDLAHLDANGLIHFHGRADTQIKTRGYRIELGEIETALNSLDCLDSSAIVAIESSGFEGKLLCCACVAADPIGGDGSAIDEEQLLNLLRPLLPRYMLPTRWLILDSMPETPNGKINRPELRQRFSERETSTRGTPTDDLNHKKKPLEPAL